MANVIISDVQGIQTTVSNSTSLIALVPGNTPQGPYEPTLVSSLQEFNTTFGSVGIPTSPTHDYVKGILAAGTRVLFLRIDSGSNQAEGSLDDKVKFTASAAGDNGNKIFCQFTTTSTDSSSSGVVSLNVFELGENDVVKTLEVHTVCSFLASTAADIDRQIFTAIPKLATRAVKVEAMKELEDFDLFSSLKTAPVTRAEAVQLDGGLDGSEDAVRGILASGSVNPFLEAGLSDKFTYNFDYITSGEYVDSKDETAIAKNLLMTALSRKECTAILEMEMTTKPAEVTNWFRTILPQLGLDLSYARSATNWVYEDEKWHAGSYSFLKVMGRSYSEVKRTLAGTDFVTGAINSAFPISESLLLNWQGPSLIGLNPICKIGNFGYVIFGQSTLATPKNGTTKPITDDDIRQMTNRIKKNLLIFSLQTLFKFRSIRTWNEFSSKIASYLEQFVAEQSITSFNLTVDNLADSNTLNTLKVLLVIDLPLAIGTIEIEMALTSTDIIFESCIFESSSQPESQPELAVVYGVKILIDDPNPASVEYTDDATSFNAAVMGEGTFNDNGWFSRWPFNLIKPCLLKNGSVVGYLNPDNLTQFEDGTAADITSGNDGDVMIEIPKIFYKFSKDDSYYYIQISNEQKEGYSDWAFSYKGVVKDKFYIGAYLGSLLDSELRSLSGKYPLASKTINEIRTYSQANGEGYEQLPLNKLILLQILYLIMFKNRDGQSALGRGLTGDNVSDDPEYTGVSNDKGKCWGETSGNYQMRFMNIEDFWGNFSTWIDGYYSDSSGNRKVTDGYFSDSDFSSYVTISTNTSSVAAGRGYVREIECNEKLGFVPTNKNGTDTTYFCDSCYNYVPVQVPYFGGCRVYQRDAGPFMWRCTSLSDSMVTLGGRLAFCG